jgi:transcriptional regulator with XRE-family HTH domain
VNGRRKNLESGKEFGQGLGLAIAKRRLRLRLTQNELSTLAGVGRGYLSDVETGRRDNITVLTLLRLSESLQIAPTKLIVMVEKTKREESNLRMR